MDRAEYHRLFLPLGSVSVYPAQSGAVIPSRIRRTDYHDEPEPPIRKRPPASKKRLRGQPESRAGDHAVARKIQRAARLLMVDLVCMQQQQIEMLERLVA